MDVLPRVMIGVVIFMFLYLFWMWFCFGSCLKRRQKTRNPQRRRMYAGSRQRPSLSQGEPTIYVSPTNLPPPPKYEALAPPSYEEVVGVHYPNYQRTQIQPITQPIAAAMAQSTSSAENNVASNVINSVSNNVTNNIVNNEAPTPSPSTPTVITVTEERTSTIRVASS